MKIYLLDVKTYEYLEQVYEEQYAEVFSNFERARDYGIEFIKKQFKNYCKDNNKSIEQGIKNENIDIDFRIVEEDIEYAEKFNKTIDLFDNIENLLIYEPTHKEYIMDYNGRITDICIRYLVNQKDTHRKNSLYLKPNDLLKNAGTKFKVGDFVKIIKSGEDDITYKFYPKYSDIYVVRYLPRQIKGQKYLRNTYALSEIIDDDFAPGIYTNEFHEEQIENYDKEVKENSPIDVLRKIFINEIKVDSKTWNNLKCGIISLKEIDKNKDMYYKKILKLN